MAKLLDDAKGDAEFFLQKASGKPSVYAARGKIKISDEHVAYSDITIYES